MRRGWWEMDEEGVDEEVEVENCTQSLIFPQKINIDPDGRCTLVMRRGVRRRVG